MLSYRVFGVITVLIASGIGSSTTAADPPPEAKKPDPVEQVRKAAETAEVHVVGVNEPMHSRLENVDEWPKLIAALRNKDRKGPVARVWEMLSEETQKKVLDDEYVAELMRGSAKGSMLKASVADDLRKIIDSRPDFYAEEAFKAIILTNEMKDLNTLGKKRTFYQTAKLNWWLLERTFPDCIPEMPKHFRTVRVQIVGGKDVVLVLSSYNPCHWEVRLLSGAKVTGIILCGYHAQEVVGVDAPVVYRCYYGPDGVSVAPQDDKFYGFDKDSERFKEFVNCVKQITAKDFTTFTAPSRKASFTPQSGDEPFTIYPNIKQPKVSNAPVICPAALFRLRAFR